MDESGEALALEKISSEVDESQIKVILSSQCIKAQAFLLDKLRKQAERHKETCGFISNANLKLETEIKQAELEISSMLIAQETIKSANVEIKKDLLLAKARKAEILQHVEEGKKRYEALWQECKARYESIPFVQKLLQATERTQTLNNEIDELDKQNITLYKEMKSKREMCVNVDRKRCIELANFMVNELPNSIQIIEKTSKEINNITNQIRDLLREENTKNDKAVAEILAEPPSVKTTNKEHEAETTDDLNKSDDDPLIPKLELGNFDLDIMDVNLEKVKMKKGDDLNFTPTPIDFIPSTPKTTTERALGEDTYGYIISPYFKRYNENETQNYAKRKLINILEDVHINNNEVHSIVKKVNPEKLRAVNFSLEVSSAKAPETLSGDKVEKTPIENDQIEEVDMTCSYVDNIIIPPTQYLDLSLTESIQKKTVTFANSPRVQIHELPEDGDNQNEKDDNDAADQANNSQLDASVASEDSYVKIKDMILKQHNLDLSPQFVYAKNPVLQKKDDDNIVKSKFFHKDNSQVKTDETVDNKMNVDEEQKDQEIEKTVDNGGTIELERQEATVAKKHIPMDVDDNHMIVSSPKQNKKDEIQVHQSKKPVSGFLFSHGSQAIPDSLNTSISTTGFEESDFPHCLDSSLLLSPKADIPATDDNPEVLSQGVPNFLSGFRKAGMSFFGGGGTSATEHKPDSSATNNDNFSFNFGCEKKNRGGLFSLFQ